MSRRQAERYEVVERRARRRLVLDFLAGATLLLAVLAYFIYIGIA